MRASHCPTRRRRAAKPARRFGPVPMLLYIATVSAVMGTQAFAQERQNRPYWLDQPVIEAIGRARTEHPANDARFSVVFEETARDAGDASASAADRARLAAAAMHARGGDALELRSAVQVAAVYEQYVDQAGIRQYDTSPDRVRNYVARVRLDVHVRDAAQTSSVLAAALATGPESATDPQFTLQDSMEAQRNTFALAARDAAQRAQNAATAAGAHLGRLLALQEGQGPCMGRGDGPGYYSSTAIPVAVDPPPRGDVSIQGARGTMTLTAQQMERLRLPNDPPRVVVDAYVCAVYAISQ